MKRPSKQILWRMAVALFALALLDVLLTTIGVVYFQAEEGNALLVELAELLPGETPSRRVVLAVWLSKMSVVAGVLLAVHAAEKSEPARDDKLMFGGLLLGLIIYTGVVASWFCYFGLYYSAIASL